MKKITRLFALAACAAVLLTGCGGAADIAALRASLTTATALSPGDEITEELADFSVTRGHYTLTVDPELLTLTVTDTESGRVWTSGPADPDSDPVATADSAELMRAQFSLDYYTDKGTREQMNSYTDSVAKGQYKVYSLPDGLAVEYLLGEPARSADNIIQKISQKRFESLVLSKLSDDERELLEGYYRLYEDEGLYVVRSSGKDDFETILALMDKAGYTEEDLEYDNTQNGITMDRTRKPSFTVTVYYYLTDKGFTAEIPVDRLVGSEGFTLHDITLLETFGAFTAGSGKGFVLVPDGSGALLREQSDADPSLYYSRAVYGGEQLVRSADKQTTGEATALPAFGVSDGTFGFVAHIADGAALATIEAYRAGRNNSLFAAYPVFHIAQMDFVKLSGDTLESTVPVFQTALYGGSCRVDYLLLSDCTDYADMAQAYRAQLHGTGVLTDRRAQGGTPLYLETLCGVYGYKSFLGVAYTGVKAATTFDQNIEILDRLRADGVTGVKLKTIGWSAGGIKHDHPAKLSFERSLGGRSGFERLLDYCQANGVGLYPDIDLQTTYTGGNGFSNTRSAVKTLDSQPALIEDISYATLYGREGDGVKPYSRRVVSARLRLSLTDKFLGRFSRFAGAGLSLRTHGSELYADYTENAQLDRAAAQKLAERQLEQIAGQVDGVMLTTGFEYGVRYADHIVRTAADNSGLLCEDESVPFLPMVLRDTVDLGSTPLNLSDDFTQAVLRCAEYGIAPLYQVCAADPSVLADTEYDGNFSASFSGWYDRIVGSWRSLSAVLDAVQGQRMTADERVADGVQRVTYENGVRIYVNYTDAPVMADGLTVPAMSFVKGAVG